MNTLAFCISLPDRAVKVQFDPPLTASNYDQLLLLVQAVHDSQELESELRRVAPFWGVVEFAIEAV